ncbi:ABC transporter permease [Pseudooceanicola sediminis]|nr:ABC transporter permease [Pseudooceanicola sediminis]|tara:strand:+ start:9384 stop:10247 length:864 start_codon:yes stop_codon:yes gene_type:complete
MTRKIQKSRRPGWLARARGEIRRAAADLDWIARIPAYIWLRLALLPALLWGWSALAGLAPAGFVAGPYLTIRAFFLLLMDDRQDFPLAIWSTVSVYFGGLGLAALVGIPLGYLLGRFRTLGRTSAPYLHGLAATPVVALIPLIILLVGLDCQAKVLIVFLAAVMPVTINTQAGVQATDPDLLEMARAYALTRGARLRHVYAPSALPSVMAGLRLAAMAGLVASAIADLYTAMTGLGALLQGFGNSYRMDSYFAVVLTYSAIGALTTGFLTWAERRLIPPAHRQRLTY